MSEQSDQKVLRIGLIQDGKILEERLMRSRNDVRVGQQFDQNDLVVPVSDLPDSFPVFEVKGDHYVLNFTGEMSGRVSESGDVRSLEELAASGRAEKGDHGYVVQLSPSARGRVQIGEVTLLFQFVTAPPERPQPALPASMRGGWISGLESTLVAVIAISALLQGGFVIWVESQDWPKPKEMSKKISDRFIEIEDDQEIDKKKKQKQKSEKSKSAKAKEKQKTSQQEPEPKEKEPSPEEQAKKEAEKQRQMAKEIKEQTVLNEIGSVTEDGGTITDALSEGVAQRDMEEAFEGSEGVTSGSGAEKSGLETSGSSDAEGTGEAAGIGDLKKTSGAKKAQQGQGTGEKQEQQVNAQVDLQQPADKAGTGTLDPGSIRNTIKRYSGQIQRCYERQLKKNNSAAGKVIVNFTIGKAGRVTQTNVQTDSVGGGVGTCVAGVIKGLRFPRPDGGEVMVNKTFVFEAGG